MHIFNSLSSLSRAKKMALLWQRFQMNGSPTVLDVGGEIDERSNQIIELHPDKKKITVINIDMNHLRRIKELHPEINVVHADARQMPFPNDSFDLVYSNAVIEHVGHGIDQAQMAREIMRVGKSWFVTTPNRWFPFEFHMRLPLASWLPADVRMAVGRIIFYNHIHRRYETGIKCFIKLLSRRELMRLFPDSEVLGCRITFMAETLIAVGARKGTIEQEIDEKKGTAMANGSRGGCP